MGRLEFGLDYNSVVKYWPGHSYLSTFLDCDVFGLDPPGLRVLLRARIWLYRLVMAFSDIFETLGYVAVCGPQQHSFQTAHAEHYDDSVAFVASRG